MSQLLRMLVEWIFERVEESGQVKPKEKEGRGRGKEEWLFEEGPVVLESRGESRQEADRAPAPPEPGRPRRLGAPARRAPPESAFLPQDLASLREAYLSSRRARDASQPRGEAPKSPLLETAPPPQEQVVRLLRRELQRRQRRAEVVPKRRARARKKKEKPPAPAPPPKAAPLPSLLPEAIGPRLRLDPRRAQEAIVHLEVFGPPRCFRPLAPAHIGRGLVAPAILAKRPPEAPQTP